MSKAYYCPICGQYAFPNTRICPYCINYIRPCESLHDENYYYEKSEQLVGDKSYSRQILIDEEVSKNPLYNPNTEVHNAEVEFEKMKKEIFSPKAAESNVPKCPTCGSTDIKSISTLKRAAHAYAFGLFSKTARSQFECRNCHYKW